MLNSLHVTMRAQRVPWYISVLSSVHKFKSTAGSSFDRGSSLDPTSKFRQKDW